MKTKNFNEFLTGTLAVLNLSVDEEGNVVNDTGKSVKPVMLNGLPVVLPTPNNIETATVINDDGIAENVKVLYNPLYEDELTGNSVVLNQIKDLIDKNLSLNVYFIGLDLIKMLGDKELQKEAPMSVINGFVSKTRTKNKQASVVAESTPKAWNSLFKKSGNNVTNSFFHIYLKKGGKKEDGTKFTRSVTCSSGLVKAINEAIDENLDKINDVTVRKADRNLFKQIISYVFKDFIDETFYTEEQNAPGFKLIMETYLKIARRINKIAKDINYIATALDIVKIETNQFTNEELMKSTETYAGEISLVPKLNRLSGTEVKEPSIIVDKTIDAVNTDKAAENDPLARYKNMNTVNAGGGLFAGTDVNANVATAVKNNNVINVAPVQTAPVVQSNIFAGQQHTAPNTNPYDIHQNNGLIKF